jgi:hypothetical protein
VKPHWKQCGFFVHSGLLNRKEKKPPGNYPAAFTIIKDFFT